MAVCYGNEVMQFLIPITYMLDIQVIILDYFYWEALLNSPHILLMAKSIMHVSHDMPE